MSKKPGTVDFLYSKEYFLEATEYIKKSRL